MTEADLLAIAEVVRKEVREEVSDIRADVRELKGRVSVLEEDVRELKADVTELKKDVAVLKEDVTVLKKDVAELKEDVAVLKEDVTTLKSDVERLDKKTSSIESEMKRTSLLVENVAIPRLNRIESCYVDTYERYKRNSDLFETMRTDIEIIKLVVTSHSERLNILFA